MNILGVSGGIKIGNQDGAAALVVDGRLTAAAEEERFVGQKFANGLLPRSAASFCLRQAGLDIRDLDAVVFAGATYERFGEILRRFFRHQFGHAPPVRLVDHHAAHAASTFYACGWDPCLIVTMDCSGDRKSTTVRVGRDGRMETLEEIGKPNSLGLYYSAVTQYLGFQRDSDEYKVMGMAAYGKPRFDFSPLLELTETGYRFHDEFLRGVAPGAPGPSKQEPLFDEFPLPEPPRTPGAPITEAHYDLAASAQRQLERAVLGLVGRYAAATGLDRVCVAGGVALNCLMNQKIRESGFVREFYAPPVCSDAGLALGAAWLHARDEGDRPAALDHAYWGPAFSPDQIRAVLDRAGASYRPTSDPARAAVRRLEQGKIVGWFQGRMEYGPRALGARSILADPRDGSIKDAINAKVKFREQFRPLAPSVPHSQGDRFFSRYADSPFMTQTFTATEAAVGQAPAVVHVDGTCRLQTVHPGPHPLWADVVSSFGKRTGLPMVLNTSLNAYNDPIACEPHQALRTYYATGLDSLVIGDFVLDKPRRASR